VTALPAHLVAEPVLERAGGGPGGVVLGVGATAAWADLDGFVVAVTTREVPLLPNAVGLAAGAGVLSGPGVVPGAAARLSPGRVDLGGLRVTWDPAAPSAWDPAVPVPAGASPEVVARRGAALLGALGAGPADLVGGLARAGLATAADPEGAAALALLFRGVRERDPDPAATASRALAGRGPGLTPEGDDLLAAVAGAVAVLGPASGFDEPGRGRFLAALAPEPGQTTALSATLLALAAEGRLAEPAGRLLDLSPAGETAWPGALSRLERLGHGSGRAYAAGIAATTTLLAADAPGR
jgi:Protein of unknown function (DUF2877)